MARQFRITTAWCQEDGENPWLLDAYDEWSEDAWGGTPDHFNEAVDKAQKGGADVRIVDLLVDYDAIEERFSAKTIAADVGGATRDGDR